MRTMRQRLARHGVTGVVCAALVMAHAASAAEPEPAPAVPKASERRPGAPYPREWFGPQRHSPHYLRAALEMVGLLGLGTAQYWSQAHANSKDWDFPRWTDRFTFDSIRFDNNTHVTNNLLHPAGGAAYYGFSRVNGLGVGESVLYAQLSSAVWEWGLEWREKVSINDMITTSVAGTAAGEFMVHLATYLNSAPGPTHLAQDIAATTLGLPVWVHRKIDGETVDTTPAPDNLGFSSAYHHRFTLDYKNAWLDDASDLTQVTHGVALAAELTAIPDFMNGETFDLWFAQGNFTHAFVDLSWSGDGLAEGKVAFDAVLAGYYRQFNGAGRVGLLAGIGSGIEFIDRDTLQRPDQIALAHLTGPVAGVFYRGPLIRFEALGRLQGDFAAIRSFAFDEVRAAYPNDVFKSSLEEGGYQYHLGFSTRLSGTLRVGAAFLWLEHTFGKYGSIEGLDRFQEKVTRDPEGSETLLEYRAGFALEPPASPLRFFAGMERLSHEGEFAGRRSGRLERRLFVGAGVHF